MIANKRLCLLFNGLAVAQLLAVTAAKGSDAVYQYSVTVGSRRAYLWIPPQCMRVRGVIMSMSNLLERNWLEDPIIRRAAADEGLGIIWLGPAARSPGASPATLTADMRAGAGEALEKMLKDLAEESGYAEIEFAPLIAMGHSANGQFSWNVPNWNADRTIAAMPIKTVPLPKSLGFERVPLCYLVGETTEWPQYRDGRPGDRDFFWPVVRQSAIALRSAKANNLVGVVTDPGGGHFDWSEHQAEFVALYIRKACRYRLPKDAAENGPVKLNRIDPESGWLTDTGGMEPDQFPPAPYKQYKGDPKKAYWYFDEETARAAVAFQGDRKKRLRQMLTFVQDGRALPVAKQGFAALKFQPEADGLTFKVEGDFLSEIPPELVGTGEKLGHAAGPIKFRVITGPAIQTGPETFRIQFDRGGMGGPIWIQEEHAGDDRYRRAVQPGQIVIPQNLAKGKAQEINFPKIEDQKAGIKTIKLAATSDSGLPVDYFVVAGPAEVEGDTLKLTPIPVRSKRPVKVTVTAYQWGRSIEPLFQTAQPVEQSFTVE
jgi:pimeloyl-ACP methyl ester carboxylesterase